MEDAGRDDAERSLKVVKLHGRSLIETWIPRNAVPFQGPGVDAELPPEGSKVGTKTAHHKRHEKALGRAKEARLGPKRPTISKMRKQLVIVSR